MCLVIPAKVITIKNKKIIIEEAGRKKEVSGSLVRAGVGDYVILQNNTIIRKVGKKSAKEIISLIKK